MTKKDAQQSLALEMEKLLLTAPESGKVSLQKEFDGFRRLFNKFIHETGPSVHRYQLSPMDPPHRYHLSPMDNPTRHHNLTFPMDLPTRHLVYPLDLPTLLPFLPIPFPMYLPTLLLHQSRLCLTPSLCSSSIDQYLDQE